MQLRQYRPKLICPAAEIISVPRLDTVLIQDATGIVHTVHQPGLFESPPPVMGDWLVWLATDGGGHRWACLTRHEFAGWEQINGATLS